MYVRGMSTRDISEFLREQYGVQVRPGYVSFWGTVFNALKARGLEDILSVVTDGIKVMTQALETACPKTGTMLFCCSQIWRNT